MKSIRDYLKKIGAAGGKAGRGNVKCRDHAHYVRASKERWRRWRENQAKAVIHLAIATGATWIWRA